MFSSYCYIQQSLYKLKYNNEYVCNTQLYNIWNQMN